ncbi:MAG: ribosome maturation factor [Balneolaceae bacterium]|nr:ribosome maturation factor [Balneolaceae bacterium]
MTPDITTQIKELAAPLAEERGLFLVDIELKSGGGTELWVYLDAEDRGVNLDECADISRELGFLIDAHELLDSKYRLNVSSPGLSRPLSDIRQYPKNVGRMLKLRYRTNGDVNKNVAQLKAVDANELTVIITEGKEEITEKIAFESVIEAKVIPQI